MAMFAGGLMMLAVFIAGGVVDYISLGSAMSRRQRYPWRASLRTYEAPTTAPPAEAARQAAFTANDGDADRRLDEFEFYADPQILGFADQIDVHFLQRA